MDDRLLGPVALLEICAKAFDIVRFLDSVPRLTLARIFLVGGLVTNPGGGSTRLIFRILIAFGFFS